MPNQTWDEERTVTVTVAKLKAFEDATRASMQAQLRAFRAADALDAAGRAHKQAMQEESDAHDAQMAAARALYEEGKA